MEKVIYSITKLGKETVKYTGVGYKSEKDLIIALTGKENKPYVKVFEDALEHCYPVKTGFSGLFNEYKTIQVEKENHSSENIEIEIQYVIWYKLAE